MFVDLFMYLRFEMKGSGVEGQESRLFRPGLNWSPISQDKGHTYAAGNVHSQRGRWFGSSEWSHLCQPVETVAPQRKWIKTSCHAHSANNTDRLQGTQRQLCPLGDNNIPGYSHDYSHPFTPIHTHDPGDHKIRVWSLFLLFLDLWCPASWRLNTRILQQSIRPRSVQLSFNYQDDWETHSFFHLSLSRDRQSVFFFFSWCHKPSIVPVIFSFVTFFTNRFVSEHINKQKLHDVPVWLVDIWTWDRPQWRVSSQSFLSLSTVTTGNTGATAAVTSACVYSTVVLTAETASEEGISVEAQDQTSY